MGPELRQEKTGVSRDDLRCFGTRFFSYVAKVNLIVNYSKQVSNLSHGGERYVVYHCVFDSPIRKFGLRFNLFLKIYFIRLGLFA